MSDLPPPPGPQPPPYGGPPPSYPSAPPGYVAYGQPAPVPANARFQSVGGIGKAMFVLLVIYLPLQVISIFASYELAGDAADYLNGDISRREFEDQTTANAANLGGLLVIPIAVLTMILMFRMAKNIHLLGHTGQTWKPGWAIGGWFCPPLLFVIPYLMFRELWKGSDPSRPFDWKRGPVAPIVTVWWLLYGVLPLIGFFTAASTIINFGALGSTDSFAEQLDDFRTINLALGVISLAASVAYLLMIRQLVARHREAIGEA